MSSKFLRPRLVVAHFPVTERARMQQPFYFMPASAASHSDVMNLGSPTMAVQEAYLAPPPGPLADLVPDPLRDRLRPLRLHPSPLLRFWALSHLNLVLFAQVPQPDDGKISFFCLALRLPRRLFDFFRRRTMAYPMPPKMAFLAALITTSPTTFPSLMKDSL